MLIFKKNTKTWQLHIIALTFVFVLPLLVNLQYEPPIKALDAALLGMLLFVVIIYGNAYWLIPYFYNKRKIALYVLTLLLLLSSTILLRSLGAVYLDNTVKPVQKSQLTITAVVYSTFTALWGFIFSIVFRFALDYFELSKKQDEIKAEQAHTELHLLKQQVHPHFLFNTLNNIYYEAQEKSPEAADLIDRLSGIMRYFIEESKKEKVFLKDEVELLKSYIELESIRMRYEMPVGFEIKGDISNIVIPPLLLLPMVENIFKHGVDKRSKENYAEITLTVTAGRLIFNTRNKYSTAVNPGGKTGLVNLEKRLVLYYEHNYQLNNQKHDNFFLATLQIPVDEN
jgi:hypothetical protein